MRSTVHQGRRERPPIARPASTMQIIDVGEEAPSAGSRQALTAPGSGADATGRHAPSPGSHAARIVVARLYARPVLQAALTRDLDAPSWTSCPRASTNALTGVPRRQKPEQSSASGGAVLKLDDRASPRTGRRRPGIREWPQRSRGAVTIRTAPRLSRLLCQEMTCSTSAMKAASRASYTAVPRTIATNAFTRAWIVALEPSRRVPFP